MTVKPAEGMFWSSKTGNLTWVAVSVRQPRNVTTVCTAWLIMMQSGGLQSQKPW
jgi:hypothetical protein